jgi:hypothetical protein
MIVGESLFGVLNAGLIVAAQVGYIHVKDAGSPLAVVFGDFAPAEFVSWAAFGALIFFLYGWKVRRTMKAAKAN